MTDDELKIQMDDCGQKMFELEQRELKFEMENKALKDYIDMKKQLIRKEILKRGTGFDSFKLKCSYRRGAICWDSKALDSYGVNHPEIMAFRKQGEPTVGFSVRSEGLFD